MVGASGLRFARVFAVMLLAMSPACSDDGIGPPEDLALQSQHFSFVSTTADATPAEMDQGVQVAEALFQKISVILGPESVPTERIIVRLEGDAVDQGPYVDFDGVHLYRYSAAENGYWALIAHELAHAFGVPWFVDRQAWNWPTYRFFDEGFAEFVAQEVDPNKTGFPFYGFPEDVVVGHWVTNGQFVPPAVLRERHEELNQPCEIQAYPQRASWLRYVDETFGRKELLELVRPDVEPTSSVVEGILGVGLAEVDAAWEDWIRARYAAFPGAATVAQAYRDRTSWAHVCRAGADY